MPHCHHRASVSTQRSSACRRFSPNCRPLHPGGRCCLLMLQRWLLGEPDVSSVPCWQSSLRWHWSRRHLHWRTNGLCPAAPLRRSFAEAARVAVHLCSPSLPDPRRCPAALGPDSSSHRLQWAGAAGAARLAHQRSQTRSRRRQCQGALSSNAPAALSVHLQAWLQWSARWWTTWPDSTPRLSSRRQPASRGSLQTSSPSCHWTRYTLSLCPRG
mmetsp:Transcript_44558/g.120043  ORF Transcript_44558/g.120043 Transcript_44558/m.120043 type:complete len:214 (-) Transcript_44558:279-920(-)